MVQISMVFAPTGLRVGVSRPKFEAGFYSDVYFSVVPQKSNKIAKNEMFRSKVCQPTNLGVKKLNVGDCLKRVLPKLHGCRSYV